jgi:hypothetical protein
MGWRYGRKRMGMSVDVTLLTPKREKMTIFW